MTDLENREAFEKWWENEGQYHRAGGNDYCKTFAYHSWMASASREGYKLVRITDEHFNEAYKLNRLG